MNQEKIDELAARKAAAPDVDWAGVEEWIDQSMSLIKSGGVMCIVLADGKPFTARKEAAQ
jgi:hypothetical protein